MARVLHLLSQRPSLTGSGITLDALVRHAAEAGWEQIVSVGVPASDSSSQVGGLPPERIRPLCFASPALPFPVPGMSDVMPYPSTRFSAMSRAQLELYREAWRRHLDSLVTEFRPHLIHSHHIWLMSSVLADVAPGVPVLNHCHATGLRQMELCPDLASEVRRGCRRNQRFAVLHRAHQRQLASTLGIGAERIHVVGAGYREELFHARRRTPARPPRLMYVGKLSAAKGLPQLLEAFTRLHDEHPELELHVAGSGAGAEAEELARRLRQMTPAVVHHGQVGQAQLAELLRRARVCVLPSFFEGLPLVLVEALACGCRLVATALPGIADELAPELGDAIELVPMPSMEGVDRPRPDGLPSFVEKLERALDHTLRKPPITDPEQEYGSSLTKFTWGAVFQRVEEIWMDLRASHPDTR